MALALYQQSQTLRRRRQVISLMLMVNAVWCSQIAAAYAASRKDVNYQLDEEAEEEAMIS